MRDLHDSKGLRREGLGTLPPVDAEGVTALKRVVGDVPADLLEDTEFPAPKAARAADPLEEVAQRKGQFEVVELNHTSYASFQKVVQDIVSLRKIAAKLLPDIYEIPEGLERQIEPESGQVLFVATRRGFPVGVVLGRVYEPDIKGIQDSDEEDDDRARVEELNVTVLHSLLRERGVGKFLIAHLKSQDFSRISFDVPAVPEAVAFLLSQGAVLSAQDHRRLGSNPSPEAILASREDQASIRMYINNRH